MAGLARITALPGSIDYNAPYQVRGGSDKSCVRPAHHGLAAARRLLHLCARKEGRRGGTG